MHARDRRLTARLLRVGQKHRSAGQGGDHHSHHRHAGCSRAATCLSIMSHRALRRASAMCVEVHRALVDYCSIQWVPAASTNTKDMENVVSTFFDDLKQLKMVLQPSKKADS